MARTKKPETETPANNAADVVINHAPERIGSAFSTDLATMLPDLPDDSNSIGRLADVFFASGYWPDLTPAQIAVQILAGQAIGLSPANAMFDLTIQRGETGPTIRWTSGQPLQTTSDRHPAADLGMFKSDGYKYPSTANLENGDSLVLEFPTSAGSAKITDPHPFDTPADIIARTDLIDKALDFAQATAEFPESDETANAGPVSDPADDTAEGQAEPVKIDSSQVSAAAPADFADISVPDIATPDMASSTATESSDLASVGSVDIKGWRASIESKFRQLGFSDDRIGRSIATFDAAETREKARLFEQASKYYATEVESVRSTVLRILAADGKETPEQMSGFFLFADVGHKPEFWTIVDAKKALDALAEFGLASDPPPAAA